MTVNLPLKPLAAVTLALSAVGASRATPPPGGAPPGTTPPDITATIVQEQQDLEIRTVGLSRARLSFPQRVSGALGVMWARQPSSFACRVPCEFKGPYVQAEPGLSGGQLSVGYAVIMGERGQNTRFLSRTYMGYGIRGALLRTWNDADLTPPDQTLLGVGGDYSIININFSLAVFRHVGSGDPEDPWVVSGGVGWGF